MNFKMHVTGGIVIGTSLATTSLLFGEQLGFPISPIKATIVFGVAVFFSLFPDLDTSSIPQRWFYRAIFLVLLGLAYYRYFEIATFLAIVSISPLLDHHRGWTHHPLSLFIFPVLLAGLYDFLLAQTKTAYRWTPENIIVHLQNHPWLVLACLLGWSTHLLLDLKILRRIKL